MIKLTSMTALQIFFFMARIIPLLASIDEARTKERKAFLGNVAEQPNKLHCCPLRENTSLKAITVAVLTIDQ
jgi:hypothetical protein